MAERTTLTASVPALVLQTAAWGVVTAASGGTEVDFSSDLDDVGGATYDVSSVSGLVAVEFDNGLGLNNVEIAIGSNAAAISLPKGTSRTLVIDTGETVELTASSDTDVTVIAYVRPA